MTLTENTVVAYKVDAPYARDCEGGVRWNDPDIGIAWPAPNEEAVLSDRDAQLPRFRDVFAATG
jgi:dTDP-4-dehydrorhamnose 3,5-epimerase